MGASSKRSCARVLVCPNEAHPSGLTAHDQYAKMPPGKTTTGNHGLRSNAYQFYVIVRIDKS